ncbi:hypothetical protein I5523_08385 [Acinetobacter oleivorans]|jgi:hypothetical protein|uniref:hypothetical protein n=1 Tax=Acinetobacter oleivorans TaxID=1148157 RepID=UPI001901EBC8|nr:hypothetical protein [Acinetobacter oleivorans]MBJ9739659.1 hypothetical protein [Acinetobacter oleivorans]MCU4409659.1 hypothetical protein [Acinetobacter oleivorans]
MSIFSESKILIEIIKIIAPFFLKIRQDINVYKELHSLEEDPLKKKKIENKTKDLIVQEATRGNKFDYESILKFNEQYKSVKLGMYHYRFLSNQDKKSIILTYSTDHCVDMVLGRIAPSEIKKNKYKTSGLLIVAGLFWFFPDFIRLNFTEEALSNINISYISLSFFCFIIGSFFAYIFFIKARTVINYEYLLSQGVIKSLPFI